MWNVWETPSVFLLTFVRVGWVYTWILIVVFDYVPNGLVLMGSVSRFVSGLQMHRGTAQAPGARAA